MVAPAVQELVRERAGRRCEYCRAPEEVTGSRYQIDHILPRSLDLNRFTKAHEQFQR